MNFALEMMAMLILYILIFVCIPLMMWKEYLKDKAYTYRFAFVTVVQSFLVINLVTYLELLHICNVYTVTLCYIFLFYFVRYFKRWHIIKENITSFGTNVQKLMFSTMGFKTFLGLYIKKTGRLLYEGCMPGLKLLKAHWLEIAALAAVLAYAFWYYSYGVMQFNHYGFGDFTVHHSWIIDMKKGVMFSEGIYPMGMHCMIYFLDLYSFFPLRNANLYFGLFQTMMMLLMLYVLVRSMCRSRFLPLLSVLIIACLHVFDVISMARLQWSLPQEVGIYSVLTCVYFLYRYLHADIKKADCKWYSIRPYFKKKYIFQSDLVLLGMSIALSISIHFYDTILAFAFCLAIAIMYLYRLCSKRYMLPLLFICLLALVISCLPFGVGLLQGRGLQASLTWATDVMKNEDVDGVVSSNTNTAGLESKKSKDEKKPAVAYKDYFSIMNKSLDQIIYQKPWSNFYRIACMLCILNGVVYLLKKDILQFSKYISLPLQGFLLVFLYDMSLLGLPMLVAQLRVYVFLILHFAMVMALALDVCYHLPFLKSRRILFLSLEGLSFAATSYAAYEIFQQGLDQKKLYQEFTIYNEAILCTDKIIKEHAENTWTVLSTINELTTTKEHGYHYELWEFLRDLEKQKPQYIPTPNVFIYVEKRPMKYGVNVYFDDLNIPNFKLSREAAVKKIPLENQTDDIYKGEDRVSVFSKTYVWAMKMMDMYPNEFKIYYEDENFICFELTQNPYHLIDLSIAVDYTDGKVWAAYD